MKVTEPTSDVVASKVIPSEVLSAPNRRKPGFAETDCTKGFVSGSGGVARPARSRRIRSGWRALNTPWPWRPGGF